MHGKNALRLYFFEIHSQKNTLNEKIGQKNVQYTYYS